MFYVILNFNDYVSGPPACGKTFASIKIADFLSYHSTPKTASMVRSIELNANDIYILDCMDIQTSKHSLESLLSKLPHNGERPRTMTIRQLIIICKNVDLNSIDVCREFLPLVRHQVQNPNTQTYFIITTNSNYKSTPLLRDEIAVLSFHQARQNDMIGNALSLIHI